MSHKQALWEVTLDLGHFSIRTKVLEAYLNTDFEREISDKLDYCMDNTFF